MSYSSKVMLCFIGSVTGKRSQKDKCDLYGIYISGKDGIGDHWNQYKETRLLNWLRQKSRIGTLFKVGTQTKHKDDK